MTIRGTEHYDAVEQFGGEESRKEEQQEGDDEKPLVESLTRWHQIW